VTASPLHGPTRRIHQLLSVLLPLLVVLGSGPPARLLGPSLRSNSDPAASTGSRRSVFRLVQNMAARSLARVRAVKEV